MLSDQQFNRLSRNLGLPRKPDDRRQKARVPYTAAIKVYPIVGKNNFESSLSVRCRDLSHGGASFLSPHIFFKGANLLMKFPSPTADHPLNVIGSVMRCERLTPVLHLVGVRFDAVPCEDHVTPPVLPKVVAEASILTHPPEMDIPAAASAGFPVLDPATSDPALSNEPTADAELARIRAAVLF